MDGLVRDGRIGRCCRYNWNALCGCLLFIDEAYVRVSKRILKSSTAVTHSLESNVQSCERELGHREEAVGRRPVVDLIVSRARSIRTDLYILCSAGRDPKMAVVIESVVTVVVVVVKVKVVVVDKRSKTASGCASPKDEKKIATPVVVVSPVVR
jgi:hypothetical protein